MCLNLCNTLRTPRAREGHFRREARDLHSRLPLFCLLGSRSTRKRRKQQSATMSSNRFIRVLYRSCLQLCHVPPPLSNSSEHPHVLQFWPSHQSFQKFSPKSSLCGQVALSLVTASGNSTPSCCSCEPSFTSGMQSDAHVKIM